MPEYKDPVIAKIIEVLKANGPSAIKSWYYGDVLVVPKSELPVVSIAKASTQIMTADTGNDDHQMPMVLTVIYDYTRSLDRSFDLSGGTQDLYDIVEGRGDDTNKPYKLNTDSIAYVLRNNINLDPTNKLWLSVGQNEGLVINYGLGIERRGPGIFSIEANIRFTARLHQTRP